MPTMTKELLLAILILLDLVEWLTRPIGWATMLWVVFYCCTMMMGGYDTSLVIGSPGLWGILLTFVWLEFE